MGFEFGCSGCGSGPGLVQGSGLNSAFPNRHPNQTPTESHQTRQPNPTATQTGLQGLHQPLALGRRGHHHGRGAGDGQVGRVRPPPLKRLLQQVRAVAAGCVRRGSGAGSVLRIVCITLWGLLSSRLLRPTSPPQLVHHLTPTTPPPPPRKSIDPSQPGSPTAWCTRTARTSAAASTPRCAPTPSRSRRTSCRR